MTTPITLHSIAVALNVPNSAAIVDLDPMDAWAALQGIARVYAEAWSAAADHHPAAAPVAQAMDLLASACEDEQIKISDAHPAPAEDMDYRLSSL